jgi:hypothetical protein
MSNQNQNIHPKNKEPDILMDSSSVVFTIDKQILQFIINPNVSSIDNDNSGKNINHPIHSVSNCPIIVTNLTDNYIVFRSKTTKKDLYVVNPPYTIIKPNNSIQILIEFYMKNKCLPNSEGHKFLFQGIVINESEINKPPKKIYEEIIKNKIHVKGNVYKRNVEFIEDKNYDYHQIPQNIPNNNINMSESVDLSRNSLYQSVNDVYQSKLKGVSKNFNDSNINQSNEFDELNNLKIEYNKLKNKSLELNTEYNILKNKIEQQKNINVNNNRSSNDVINKKFHYVPPDSKEIKLSQQITIYICIFSLIIGFFLTK